MLIYLDNCCFNRPYDDQGQLKIRLESEAKLVIQERIIRGELKLIWSFILEYENDDNPFAERRRNIEKWRSVASEIVLETEPLIGLASDFNKMGLKAKDSLHLAAATVSNCIYFITTDDGIMKKANLITSFKVINPVDFFTKELQ
ncbi:MAG: PIN domain protein [Bacteroidia bacterium]|nr:PIN domain protein [Bacteroidia bacterium]